MDHWQEAYRKQGRSAEFIALVLGLILAGCHVDTGSMNPGDNDFLGNAVSFPTSGDRTIVSTSAQEGDLIVFGDQATAVVNRMRMSHPEFVLDVHFDAAARPIAAELDGLVVEFTHHDDGTFDYILSEDGAEISSGHDLALPSVGAALSSVDRRAKSLATYQDSSLDLLLCAGDRVNRVAREECGRRGQLVSGDDFDLALQMRADRQMVSGGLLLCALGRVGARIDQDASAHCGNCAQISSSCCDRIDSARTALLAIVVLVEYIMGEAAAGLFDTNTSGDPCQPPEASPPPPPPPPPPPRPEPTTDCSDDRCFYCWVGTRYEGACPSVFDGDGTCDCGCQFDDSDCATADDEPPGDDEPGDDEPPPAVGMASAAVCPEGFTINVSGDHVPALREVVFHSFLEDMPFFARCFYVRRDGVNPDRLIDLSLWYRPPSAGTPHGDCGRRDEGEIVTGISGCRERRSTQRTITAVYCLSTPIVDGNAEPATDAVLDELVSNAVQAGVGAACP